MGSTRTPGGTGTHQAAALGLLAALALGAPGAMAAERVRGIDVSRFQGEIVWNRVGETKIRFAFVQASRGSGNDCAVVPSECGPDGFYERNYRRARANGIRVGAYHRAFAGGGDRAGAKRDARAEARVFLEQVGKLRRRDLLPALDVETPFDGLDPQELRTWIRTWLKRVEAELGVKPIIYTNHSSWQATGDTRAFARDGHRLWVAQWKVRSPLVPAGSWNGQGWSVWQYTSSGSVRGIEGNVDRNRLGVPMREIAAR